MNKLSALGGVLTIFGLLLLVFKVIGAATGKKILIADSTLSQVMSPEKLEQIDNLSKGFLHTCASTIVAVPLYGHLIIFGIIILVISGLTSK